MSVLLQKMKECMIEFWVSSVFVERMKILILKELY